MLNLAVFFPTFAPYVKSAGGSNTYIGTIMSCASLIGLLWSPIIVINITELEKNTYNYVMFYNLGQFERLDGPKERDQEMPCNRSRWKASNGYLSVHLHTLPFAINMRFVFHQNLKFQIQFSLFQHFKVQSWAFCAL